MTKKTALIADDEPAARRQLIALLHEHAALDIVGEAGDGRTAEREIVRLKPDVVFLDIQMPERDGLTVAANTVDQGYQLVFVTAFDEYAIQAFETHAIDYLLKPVRAERLQKTLAKLVGSAMPQVDSSGDLAVDKLLEVLNNTRHDARISVRHGSASLLVNATHIGYVEAIVGYCRIHLTAEGQRIHKSQTIISDTALEKIQQTLPEDQFIRVHRSFIVNQLQIQSQRIEDRRTFVRLFDFPETPIPVSRANVRLIKDRWPSI
ncbi:MAG: LytR/AlgR family response regulator transcription factor [Pseudomonadales bacterium]